MIEPRLAHDLVRELASGIHELLGHQKHELRVVGAPVTSHAKIELKTKPLVKILTPSLVAEGIPNRQSDQTAVRLVELLLACHLDLGLHV